MSESITLDVRQAKFDHRGMHSLDWPITRAESLAARNAMLHHLVQLSRCTGPRFTDGAAWPAMRVLFKWIVLEGMAIYHAQAIQRRLLRTGRALDVPSYYRRTPRSATDPVLPDERLLQTLVAGPPAGSGVPGIFRRLGRDLQWNGLHPGVLLPPDPERQVIALQHNSLLAEQVRGSDRLVRYALRHDWFAHLARNGRTGDPADDSSCSGLADAILNAFEHGFRAGGEELSGAVRAGLSRWLRRALQLAEARLHLLEGGRKPLPSELWITNGGDLWSALLARAVRRTGGRVVGHEHGYGTPYLKSMVRQFVQLDHCDDFVSYNEAQADAIRRTLEPDLLIGSHMPVIRAGKRVPREDRPPPPARSRPIQTLMYIGAPFFGDRLNLLPAHPDLVSLDWQARLFGKLQQWGIRVLHKPHPEGDVQPPPGFAEFFGHHTLTERFERVADQADAFLFDHPLTTTFPVALRTGRPVILVDLDYAEWLPEARTLMERRCRVVRGSADTGRIEVDWEALHEAVCGKHPEPDMAFVGVYHGGDGH